MQRDYFIIIRYHDGIILEGFRNDGKGKNTFLRKVTSHENKMKKEI